MNVPRVEYMYWAKTSPRVKYDLSSSGVPDVAPEEYGARPGDLSAGELGPYGHPELIQLVAERYGVAEDNVVLVPGTSTGVYLALSTSIERRDTVLVESPAYDLLFRSAQFFGAEFEFVPRLDDEGYAPDLDAVERGLRNGSRAVLLSDLHNPSGRALGENIRKDLVELTARHDAYLIIDEVYGDYAHVNCGRPLRTAASLAPHVITTSSLTKVYGLGGLRTGWLLAEPSVADRARNVMDHLSVNNSAPGMNLAIRAFRNMDRLVARTHGRYERGWPVVRQWLADRPDVSCTGNDGATFVFLNLGPEVETQRILDLALSRYETKFVPGRFFDRPHHLRLGFCLPPDDLREALSRLGECIDEVGRR